MCLVSSLSAHCFGTNHNHHCSPSWELTYPFPKHSWVDDFPFPKVGYELVPWRVKVWPLYFITSMLLEETVFNQLTERYYNKTPLGFAWANVQVVEQTNLPGSLKRWWVFRKGMFGQRYRLHFNATCLFDVESIHYVIVIARCALPKKKNHCGLTLHETPMYVKLGGSTTKLLSLTLKKTTLHTCRFTCVAQLSTYR